MIAGLEIIKADTEVNRHIVGRLSNDYEMEGHTTLHQPFLCRVGIERIWRDWYHDLEDGKGEAAARHALYAGGSTRGGPDGGGGWSRWKERAPERVRPKL